MNKVFKKKTYMLREALNEGGTALQRNVMKKKRPRAEQHGPAATWTSVNTMGVKGYKGDRRRHVVVPLN